ncbi:AMP-binding protein [Kiloniella sp. b19]|uniref:AMP-binding protein n=1 Tax=Kiloniella sp. GXU_MW_B19 TaxID=3141326 RepID=UPI0031DDD904
MSLFQAFLEAFPNDPDQTVLWTCDSEHYSYRDLYEFSGQLANALQQNGLKSGDTIAIQTGKSADLVFLYLASLRVGLTCLPLNPSIALSDLSASPETQRLSLLVCSPDKEEQAQESAADLNIASILTLGTRGDGSLMSACITQDLLFQDSPLAADTPAALLPSGTTENRAVLTSMTQADLLREARDLVKKHSLNGEDVLLHALPAYQKHGLFSLVNMALLSGSKICYLKSFDAVRMTGLLPRITVMAGNPVVYQHWISSSSFTGDIPQSVRSCLCAGGLPSKESSDLFYDYTRRKINIL